MNYKRSQLRSLILSSLSKGEFKLGDQLPTENEMTRKYGMSRATVREGIALLVQEGVLSRRRGAGTFVSRLKPATKGKMVAALIQCTPGQWDSFGQLAHQIEQRVHEQGNSLILCNHEGRKDKLEVHLQRIIDGGIAGVIFSPIQLPGYKEYNLQIVRRLEDHGIPFVLIASPISSDTLSRYSFVSSNGFEATRKIVQHLTQLGHRRIAYIQGFAEVFAAEERFNGFLEEMRRQRLDVPESYIQRIQVGDINTQGRQEVKVLLACDPAPTAVICIHDVVAKNVMEEVQAVGLKVPRDIAVVGFDDAYFASTLNPPLTTVLTPLADEAALDVKILFDKINGTATSERQEFLPCELVIRESCGASPRASRETVSRSLTFEKSSV